MALNAQADEGGSERLTMEGGSECLIEEGGSKRLSWRNGFECLVVEKM